MITANRSASLSAESVGRDTVSKPVLRVQAEIPAAKIRRAAQRIEIRCFDIRLCTVKLDKNPAMQE